MAKRPLGAKVAEGDVVASISDPLVDSVRLDDLHLEVNLAKAGWERLAAERAVVTLRQEVLAKRLSGDRAAVLEVLRHDRDASRSGLALDRADRYAC